MLPNLSGLAVCVPCGVPFDRWDDALAMQKEERAAGRTDEWRSRWTQDDVCTICHEPLEDKADEGVPPFTHEVEALIETNTCGHVYHKQCLVKWINTDTGKRFRCPVCNVPIAEEVKARLKMSSGGGWLFNDAEDDDRRADVEWDLFGDFDDEGEDDDELPPYPTWQSVIKTELDVAEFSLAVNNVDEFGRHVDHAIELFRQENGADARLAWDDPLSEVVHALLGKALTYNTLGVARKLLEFRPSLDRRDNEFLFHAINTGRRDVVAFLLENGASVRGSAGRQALEAARERGDLVMEMLLLEKGARAIL